VALILDTNALSAAADCEPDALEVVAGAERLAVPVLVLSEYRLGIEQSRHRADYEKWLLQWIAAVSVLEIEQDTTHHYAEIGPELKRIGKLIPTNDLWIAVRRRQHALPLLSRDLHFDAVPGLQRLSW
jgi:tRNA(fMet)-specific endonuclease VapC